MCVKSPQSCPTLCDPMDSSSPGSSVYGILQERILEWVAVPSSWGSSQPWAWLRSPTLWTNSLLTEPPGKPKNTGVGSLSLLQGIFPTQGSNPGLPHYTQFLYHLSHQGSPKILEWAAYPFSRGSSLPRDRTVVSCIVGGFFTSWATREACK